MSDRVECFGEVQGKHTDEWKHGQHGKDCVEESNDSSVCRTSGSERELISKMESCRAAVGVLGRCMI